MKKKLIFAMSAIVALFATSCQEEDFGVSTGATSTVAFTVSTPEITSRAYSDGATATVLLYAVYDADGNELTALTKTDATINGSATVQLDLITGDSYSVIFWAAAPNAPYTVDFANKTMTVNYTNPVSNDENRDAFYAYKEFTVNGSQTETVVLKRPFAQLNIGTNDYDTAEELKYIPTQSTVTVKNIYSTLNLADGTVDGDTAVTFGLADIEKDEEFPVDGYKYIAMNYLLVDTTKALVNVEFTCTDGTKEKTRTVGSVPVQRNYRTNIYGKILTSEVDVNIEIEPDYNEPAHELDALHKAAAFGGEFTLTEDIVLDEPLEVKSNLTIDLNGKTISGNYHKSKGAIIKNTATLTIIGGDNGGTISSLGDNGGSAVQNNGTMIIKDALLNGAPNANGEWPSYTVNNTGKLTISNSKITSYHGAVASYGDGAVVTMNDTKIDMTGIAGFTSHGIYTYNNGKVIVNGGDIANNATDQAASGASVINGAVEVNAGKFTGRIENYYGTPVIKGGIFSVKPNDNFIAAGYKAVNSNGKWYVVAEDVAVVSTDADFQTALSAGNNIVLAGDVNISKIDLTTQTQDIVIDGNGKTITTASNYGVEVTAGKNITLKNAEIEITVVGDYINYAAGFKIANGDYAGKTIKLENCVIEMANTDWAYAVNMPASVKNLNLEIDNCTLEGAIALQCWGDDNTITITNSNLICNYTTNALYTSYCVALQGDGTNNAERNTLNISGCHFSYSGVDNYNSVIKAAADVKGNNTIEVSNCTSDNKVTF